MWIVALRVPPVFSACPSLSLSLREPNRKKEWEGKALHQSLHSCPLYPWVQILCDFFFFLEKTSRLLWRQGRGCWGGRGRREKSGEGLAPTPRSLSLLFTVFPANLKPFLASVMVWIGLLPRGCLSSYSFESYHHFPEALRLPDGVGTSCLMLFCFLTLCMCVRTHVFLTVPLVPLGRESS